MQTFLARWFKNLEVKHLDDLINLSGKTRAATPLANMNGLNLNVKKK